MVRLLKLSILCLVIGFFVVFFLPGQDSKPSASTSDAKKKPFTGMADVQTFLVGYNRWAEEYKRNGGDRYLNIPVAPFSMIASEPSDAHGSVIVDLQDGTVRVEIDGLKDGEFDVWLINNRPGAGRSVKPETGDDFLFAGKLANQNDKRTAKLFNVIGANVVSNFNIDVVGVTRAGQDPNNGLVLWGTPTLYQRLYLSGLQGHFGRINSDNAQNISYSLWPKMGQSEISEDGIQAMEEMIAKGRDLFLNETFAGNERTCGTCHREEAEFTISPDMIAKLPPTDPIFVAEFNPALAQNFEIPAMLRSKALFIENVDGMDDLANKFVLRSSQPVLAQSISLKAPFPTGVVDFSTIPPVQRTGWSGDGAPGTGTLREFPLGAINQHFPKSLNRKAGVDFRLPTDEELDAMEAFQLSIGRSEDFDLQKLVIKPSMPALGQKTFSDFKTAKCETCHINAGGNSGVGLFTNTPLDQAGVFETAVDLIPGIPKLPPDGGFGLMPRADGGFGDIRARQFSAPALVEAASHSPLFHNNALDTVEDAVAFYSTKTFNRSQAGKDFPLEPLVGGIKLTKKQNKAVASMLRVLNTLENMRFSNAIQLRAKDTMDSMDAAMLLKMSLVKDDNSINVLSSGTGPKITGSSQMVAMLKAAQDLARQAMTVTDPTMRNQMIDQAIAQKKAVRDMLVDPTTLPPTFQQ